MDRTDQQWTIIEQLFEEKRRLDGRGLQWRDARALLSRVACRQSSARDVDSGLVYP